MTENALTAGPEKILRSVMQALASVPEKDRADVFSCAIVELLNAGGLPMDGETVQSPLHRSPAVVNEIAMLLGKKSTLTRNKYSIYPFARPSICASGPCFYIDTKTGNLMMLLHRRIKDSHQWLYPTGYMEMLPPNVSYMQQERVSEALRNKAEEATMGVHFDIPETETDNRALSSLSLPNQSELRTIIYAEYKRLLMAERWDVAVRKIYDRAYLEALLARHSIAWPERMDVTTESTFIRETFEETGFDLTQYPHAVIRSFCHLDATIASGGARIYNVEQMYFGYLGFMDAAPKLTQNSTEVVEAAWIAVCEIHRDEKTGDYIITKDGRPLHPHVIQGVESSNLALLNMLIEQVSMVKKHHTEETVPLFSNAAGIQAALIAHSTPEYTAINELISIQIGAEKTLPSMMHDEGQAIFRSFIAAASGLAERKSAKEVEIMINKAKTESSSLLALLKP